MPHKSWLNNRLHHTDSSLQWKRRLFSINLKLIHYYSGLLPSSSCQENKKVNSIRDFKETVKSRSPRTQRRTEGRETPQETQPGTIGHARATSTCYRGRTPATTTGQQLTPTKLAPHSIAVNFSSNLDRAVEDYDITCVFYLYSNLENIHKSFKNICFLFSS